MDLKARDLAYWDAPNHLWRVEKEQVRVLAGGSSDKLPVQAMLNMETSFSFGPITMRAIARRSQRGGRAGRERE
jgi:hypothetical protein